MIVDTEKLAQAISNVDHLALAPLKRIQAAMPKDFYGAAYVEWRARKTEVFQQVETNLKSIGARISFTGDSTRFSLSGIASSSTMGLIGAITNWRGRAAEQLKAGRRTWQSQ